MTLDFSRLAELAADRAWRYSHPTIDGRTYCIPATRADAERAAREIEAAGILWRSVCQRSCAECLSEAQAYREGPTLEDTGLI